MEKIKFGNNNEELEQQAMDEIGKEFSLLDGSDEAAQVLRSKIDTLQAKFDSGELNFSAKSIARLDEIYKALGEQVEVEA